MQHRTIGRRRGRRHSAHCPATGKIRYRDGDDAGLALKGLSRARSRADLEGASHRIRVVRKYACPACGGWHLTSWPGNPAQSAA